MVNVSKYVAQSIQLAQQAGDSLATIVTIADSAADKIRSIATASEEQSASSEQINSGTEQINNIARQNADKVGAAAEAVKQISHVTNEMKELVATLKKA